MLSRSSKVIALRIVESLAILVFLVLMVFYYYRLFSYHVVLNLVAGMVVLPISFFVADLLTGIVHWAFDTFGNSKTPVWGPLFVAPFRRHHDFPFEITQTSLAENLGSSCYAGVLALVLRPIRPPERGIDFLHLLGEHFWISLVVFSMLANLFHRWSHIPISKRPKWLIFLQRSRIVLSHKEHLAHHTKPFRTHYCILSGWANGMTNRFPWSKVEQWISRIGIHRDMD